MDTDNTSPWTIVREYVKGKLIINKDGILERNKDYICITTDLSMELTNKLDMIYRYLWEKYGRKWH